MIKLKDILNENIDKAEAVKIVNKKLKELGHKPIKESDLTTWGGQTGPEYDFKMPNELKSYTNGGRIEIVVQFNPEYHHTYNHNPGIWLNIRAFIFPAGGTENSSSWLYEYKQQYVIAKKSWNKPIRRLK